VSLLKISDAARLLNVERLRQVLNYDPGTGIFTWKIQPHARFRVGDVAGATRQDGYIHITVDKVHHLAHRLAWLHVSGEWPTQTIDHINGIKNDNRIANLREFSTGQNQQNRRKPHKTNKVGLLGVTWQAGRFCANIQINKKKIWLGRFDTADEAHAAYIDAKRRLHEGCTI
jgi:hypothetical protein